MCFLEPIALYHEKDLYADGDNAWLSSTSVRKSFGKKSIRQNGRSPRLRARESQLASELFGDDLEKVLPVVRPGGSDSATFDNVLELLVLAGRSLPHAIMMMIPEAYADRDDLPDHLKGFYAFHSCLMEPWDGPASVCFTDGTVVGATLDRNGLRPGRWVETTDGYVMLGSETGMLPVAPGDVVRLGRLAPGKLFLVDLEAGRLEPLFRVRLSEHFHRFGVQPRDRVLRRSRRHEQAVPRVAGEARKSLRDRRKSRENRIDAERAEHGQRGEQPCEQRAAWNGDVGHVGVVSAGGAQAQ